MKLDIFGDVLTHGHNWAKMRNKEKRWHAKDGTERGQKGPRPDGLGPSEPAGLAHFQAQSASVFFSTKYSSTLACVLPKAGLGPSEPAGLAHFQAQSASVFFSAKYSSTLACVLPKPPTRTAYIYPKAAVKEGKS